MSAVALGAGYVADRLVGDPGRAHPVAGFGRLASAANGVFYSPSRARGAAFVASLVGLAALAGELASRSSRAAGLTEGAALAVFAWAALGGRSLCREADAIAARLRSGEIEAARAALPALAGRDPETLDAVGITRAVVESVAENTSDAVVGALFWGALGGAPAVAAFRAANTLDAMIGHRSPRYSEFGWAAARLDDAMGWPAARIGAGLAVLCAPLAGGSPRRAWRMLRRDGAAHPSPNAGRMEAAFAGALGVQLGGDLSYRRRIEPRPRLGDGEPPVVADITRATGLSSAVGAAALLLCTALSWRLG
ncbi:MAG TPA: cobalamin biosynthesis protein [Thermoleophilaceae bacterium]|nr:cobalamin biosynthesis protein [Thermoleophilaceae bacterium]